MHPIAAHLIIPIFRPAVSAPTGRITSGRSPAMIRRVLFGLLALLSFDVSVIPGATTGFDGIWRGTYNGQPTKLNPDGTYPESVNEFELSLHDKGGTVTGEFVQRRRDGSAPVTIINGKRFGDRACFDVVTDRDMRWCVWLSGDELAGSWSAGPEGGPMTGGGGAGARLFKISAKRVGTVK